MLSCRKFYYVRIMTSAGRNSSIYKTRQYHHALNLQVSPPSSVIHSFFFFLHTGSGEKLLKFLFSSPLFFHLFYAALLLFVTIATDLICEINPNDCVLKPTSFALIIKRNLSSSWFKEHPQMVNNNLIMRGKY
jgi:hypothetical protein